MSELDKPNNLRVGLLLSHDILHVHNMEIHALMFIVIDHSNQVIYVKIQNSRDNSNSINRNDGGNSREKKITRISTSWCTATPSYCHRKNQSSNRFDVTKGNVKKMFNTPTISFNQIKCIFSVVFFSIHALKHLDQMKKNLVTHCKRVGNFFRNASATIVVFRCEILSRMKFQIHTNWHSTTIHDVSFDLKICSGVSIKFIYSSWSQFDWNSWLKVKWNR